MIVTVFCLMHGMTSDRHAILTFHTAFAENQREKSPRVSWVCCFWPGAEIHSRAEKIFKCHKHGFVL